MLEINGRVPAPQTKFFWYQARWDVVGTTTVAMQGELHYIESLAPKELANPKPKPEPPPKPVLGRDGKALPPIASTLSPTPSGHQDINELNKEPEKYLDQEVIFDALSHGTISFKREDNYVLLLRSDRPLALAKFGVLVDQATAEKLTEINKQNRSTAIRCKGKMLNLPFWKHTVLVNEVGILGTDGKIVATFLREKEYLSKDGQTSVIPPAGTIPVRPAAPAGPAPAPPSRTTAAKENKQYEIFDKDFESTVGKKYTFNMRLNSVNQFAMILNKEVVPATKYNLSDRFGGTIYTPTFYSDTELGKQVEEQMKKSNQRFVNAEVTFQPIHTDLTGFAIASILEVKILDQNFKNAVWTGKGKLIESKSTPSDAPAPSPKAPPLPSMPSGQAPPASASPTPPPRTNVAPPAFEPVRPPIGNGSSPKQTSPQPIAPKAPTPQPAPQVPAQSAPIKVSTPTPPAEVPVVAAKTEAALGLPLAITLGVVGTGIAIGLLVWANKVLQNSKNSLPKYGKSSRNTRDHDDDDDDNDDEPAPKRAPPKNSRNNSRPKQTRRNREEDDD